MHGRQVRGGVQLLEGLKFQAEATRLIRKALPTEKGLIGFVARLLPLPGEGGSSGSATVELLEGPRRGERLVASVDQASEISGSSRA